MPDQSTTKPCTRCRETKPLDAFGIVRGRPDSRCKECKTALTKAWRVANADRARATDRAGYAARKARDPQGVRQAQREAERRYAQTHRAERRAKRREDYPAYYAEHGATIRARSRHYRKEHAETVRITRHRHYLAHREDYFRHRDARRGRLRSAAVRDFTAAQWREAVAYFNGHCGYCGERCDRPEQEHMLPLSRGGDHTAANIIPACRACNARKGNKTLAEYLLMQ